MNHIVSLARLPPALWTHVGLRFFILENQASTLLRKVATPLRLSESVKHVMCRIWGLLSTATVFSFAVSGHAKDKTERSQSSQQVNKRPVRMQESMLKFSAPTNRHRHVSECWRLQCHGSA